MKQKDNNFASFWGDSELYQIAVAPVEATALSQEDENGTCGRHPGVMQFPESG